MWKLAGKMWGTVFVLAFLGLVFAVGKVSGRNADGCTVLKHPRLAYDEVRYLDFRFKVYR